MKSRISAVALLALFPTYTTALVGLSWSAANVPSSGLKDITFPINMANATHTSGYYYAQQFGFNGVTDIGYTGIQPRPNNAAGQSIVHGVFSSFIDGTTTSDSQCSYGADGGPGVSCSVEVASSYAHTYNFVVENTAGTTWTGTMVDTVTGAETHIGTWTLPAGTSGIKSSQVGFVEYYLWNDGKDHPCDTLPKTEVFFGTPTTTTSGAGPVSLGDAYEYGNCVGQVDFQTSHSSAGVCVAVGFANP